MADINTPPAGGFQNGGWYWDPSANQARQYWNGSFGAPGQINNPNQSGFKPQSSNASANNSNPAPTQSTPVVPQQSFEDLAQKAIQMNQQAVQPAVDALKATKQPLQDRYTALLSQIKNNQSIAENRQTVTTNNELGARGILPSSGLAQQTLTNAVNPITQEYSAEYGQTAAGENSDLANIDAQIAQLLSGAATSGINTGASLYGTNLNAGLQGQQLALSSQQLQNTIQQQAIQNALAQAQLANQTKQTAYETSKPYFSPLEIAQAKYYNDPKAFLNEAGINLNSLNSSGGLDMYVGK